MAGFPSDWPENLDEVVPVRFNRADLMDDAVNLTLYLDPFHGVHAFRELRLS
jgi:hypothetical protein